MRTALLQNSAVILLLLFLASCSNDAMFDVFAPINDGWHQDSIVQFTVPVKDTSANYAILVKLRHDANYNYENIYLFRTISSAEGIEYQDTVDLKMADDRGKWLGEGVGEIKTMAWAYGRGALRFNNVGKYTFSLQHGMRDTVLNGVINVGLTIKEINERAK